MAGLSIPEGFFWGNDPNVNQQLRQRIALQMMAQKRPFPKTIGEGLSAIGDSIGEIGMARRLEQGDLDQQNEAKTTAAGFVRGGAAQPSLPPVGKISEADTPDTSGAPPTRVAYAPTDTSTDATEPAPDVAAAKPDASVPPSADTGAAPAPDPAKPPTPLRPTPAYIQDTINKNVTDPNLRAYYGSLVAGEAPNGPADRSPTGADGPFQFIPSTARQYGLIGPNGDLRRDLQASIDAVKKLTQDNADAFRKINGRDPTMSELALMHQQGGVTGARMVAGTGNAPPNNLAVNNIDPNASAAQAVAKIKKYYGMPDTVVDPRDRIAQVISQTQPQPQQPPPQRLALNGLQGPPAAGIQQAPQLPPQIRQAPPQPPQQPPMQIAQNAAQPGYGYVMPQQAPARPPQPTPYDPRELEAARVIAANPNNPYITQNLAPVIAPLKAARELKDAQNQKQYEADIIAHRELMMKREEQIATRARREVEGQTAEQALEDAKRPKPTDLKGKYIWDPQSGTYKEPVISGTNPDAPPNVELTEPQGKMMTFYNWGRGGNDVIKGNDQLLANGLAQEMAGKIPFVGNKIQQAEYRRARTAANNFVLSFMRDTSGAAYGAKEMYDHAAAFLPRYGDDPQTLADKAQQRQRYVDSLYAGMGTDARKAADWANKQSAPTATDIEMEGVPKIPGEIKTNKKTGSQRMWNERLGHWVEVKNGGQ